MSNPKNHNLSVQTLDTPKPPRGGCQILQRACCSHCSTWDPFKAPTKHGKPKKGIQALKLEGHVKSGLEWTSMPKMLNFHHWGCSFVQALDMGALDCSILV